MTSVDWKPSVCLQKSSQLSPLSKPPFKENTFAPILTACAFPRQMFPWHTVVIAYQPWNSYLFSHKACKVNGKVSVGETKSIARFKRARFAARGYSPPWSWSPVRTNMQVCSKPQSEIHTENHPLILYVSKLILIETATKINDENWEMEGEQQTRKLQE